VGFEPRGITESEFPQKSWVTRPSLAESPEPIRPLSGGTFSLLVVPLLQQGLNVQFTVTGTSMAPFLKDGDKVVVAPVKPGPLNLGDLALFRRRNQSLVLHRLVKRESGARPILTFKGDAVSECDEPVELDQVLGIVIKIEKLSGRILATERGAAFLNRLSAAFSILRSACRRFFIGLKLGSVRTARTSTDDGLLPDKEER
jgi:hypothetical protein